MQFNINTFASSKMQQRVFACIHIFFNLLITSFFNFIIKVSLVFVCDVVHVEIGLACAVPVKRHHAVGIPPQKIYKIYNPSSFLV